MRLFIFYVLVFPLIHTFAQTRPDTITVMCYNLLYYNATTDQCNSTTNNVNLKDEYMKTIIGHTVPDILAVQEMAADNLGQSAKRLMDRALNQNGRNQYAMANYAPPRLGSLSNALYYNKNKFIFKENIRVDRDLSNAWLVRPIDGYVLYFNDPEKLSIGDTTYFTVFSVHLKAGSTTNDRTQRANATASFMDYLEKNYQNHNYFIMGDFNAKTSSEQGIQNLVNYKNSEIRFYDPIDKVGSWFNNGIYSDLHTQSTRTTATQGGCFSGGGLDDRFDIIFVGNEVLNNARGVNFVKGSYRSVGNDGLRLKNSLIAPTNISETPEVINALYYVSDHLPVLMKVTTDKTFVGIDAIEQKQVFNIVNPSKNQLSFASNDVLVDIEEIKVINLQGKELVRIDAEKLMLQHSFNTFLQSGVYIVYIKTKTGSMLTYKWVIVD